MGLFSDHLTDERTVENIQENPYMQYFLGLHEFHSEPLFDPSILVHFRKRFPVEELAKINEFICTGRCPETQRNVDLNDENDHEPPVPPANVADEKDETSSTPSKQSGKPNRNTSQKKKEQQKRKKNRGKLLLDATVAPADIKYPTDIDLLNKCREHLETAIEIL